MTSHYRTLAEYTAGIHAARDAYRADQAVRDRRCAVCGTGALKPGNRRCQMCITDHQQEVAA